MVIFKYVKKYANGYKKNILILILLSCVSAGLSLLIPKILGGFIDFINYSTDSRGVYKYIFIFFAIHLGKIITSFITKMLFASTKVDISYNISKYLFAHVQKLPLSFFRDKDTIYITDRINHDSNLVVEFSISNLIGVIVNFLSIVIVSIIMIRINYVIGIIILCGIPIYCILYKVVKKKLYIATLNFKESQSEFFSSMNNQIKDIKFIKINCIYSFLRSKLDKSFKLLKNNFLKYCKISFCFTSTGTFINSLLSIFLILYSGLNIINGNMTIGDFITINAYFGTILNYVSYFIELGNSYQSTLVSCNRLIEIENIDEEFNGNVVLDNINKIEVKKLKFSFLGSTNMISNLTYEFKKDNIYLLKGKNGVGKSTFINLILGLYEDYSGDILFNDVNIKKIDMHHLRRNVISVLEQEPSIMELDIEDNVKVGNDIDEELVYKLYDVLGLRNIEENHQYDVIKKEIVSGGEKQKISIVRAISKKSDILILDEPTSALDDVTSQKLKSILKELKKDKIIIIISHDSIFDDICDYNIKFNQQVLLLR